MLVPSLGGCSPIDLLNAVNPGIGAARLGEFRYREGDRGLLDLYRPVAVPTAGAPPIIVFFYGGSWAGGIKADYRFAGEALAARGYIVAIPDYRVYPEIRYPAFLEDAASAVAQIRDIVRAQELPADGPLLLMGHSSGAHMAAMLAMDPRWLSPHGMTPSTDLSAMIGLAGPYDFLPLRSEQVKAVFAPASDELETTQPISYVDSPHPPLVLAAGLKDEIVVPENSISLHGAVQGAGGKSDLILYEGLGHRLMVASLAWPLRWFTDLLDDVDDRIRAILEVDQS